MSRPKQTFDDRLEALIIEADLGQLYRMKQLSEMQLRIAEKRNGTQPAPRKRKPSEQKELPINE